MAFCKLEFIIIKSNYFQSAQKDECFLDCFEAREIEVRALVLQKAFALVRKYRFRTLLSGREMSF
jgi:hypothetical protein